MNQPEHHVRNGWAQESIAWLFADDAPAGLRHATLDIGGRPVRLKCWHGPTSVSVPEGYCLWPAAVALARYLPSVLHPRSRILDAGCGCGLLSVIAGKLGCQVVLVDSSPDVLLLAFQNCRDNQVVPQALLCEDWAKGQTAVADQFDVVIASDTFYPQPEHDFGVPMIRYLSSSASDCYLSLSGSEYAQDARTRLGSRLKSEAVIPFPSANERAFDCHVFHFAGEPEELSVVGCRLSVVLPIH